MLDLVVHNSLFQVHSAHQGSKESDMSEAIAAVAPLQRVQNAAA
jgi:hypothetical protein